MTSAVAQRRSGSYIDRPSPSSLADVVELILDKGLVIDAYVRVSLVGIELLTIDARIVVASVDTYLRFAEATNRLNLQEEGGGKPLDEMIGSMQERGARGKTRGATRGALDTAKDKVSEITSSSDDEDSDDDDASSGGDSSTRRRPRSRQSASRRRSSRSEDDE